MEDNYRAAVRLFPIVAGSGVLVLPLTEKIVTNNLELKFFVGAISIGIISSSIIYLFATISDKKIHIETEDA